MSDWVNVAYMAAMQEGEHLVIDVDGTDVAVFKINGDIYAIEDVCTHDGGEIASGELEGDEIVCPRHGARFCIKTGEIRCAPAYENLATFPTQIINGMIQVRDARWD